MSDHRTNELKRELQADPNNEEALLELINLRARTEGPEVYLEALRDRLVWNETPIPAQDLAINEVSKRLREAFRWIETKVYECAAVADHAVADHALADHGISHRIATFEHVRSGAILNLIPGGTFMMGSEEKESEQPIHEVTIEAMLIGRTQVRQSTWDEVGGEDERYWSEPNLPIDSVSWEDCKAWLKQAGDGLRLPSEAEWEYACRAGSTTAFCFGKTVTRASQLQRQLSLWWSGQGTQSRENSGMWKLALQRFWPSRGSWQPLGVVRRRLGWGLQRGH